jgi:proline iminopeptidase
MKQLLLLTLVLLSFILFPNAYGQDLKVNSHGLDIHYRIIGQGVPLLILGGGPGDVADRCLSLCELLSKNQQCILVEQRGTGQSSPAVYDASTISVALTLDDFEAIRRQLGLKQWAVLGFSYGGYLASLYSHYFPASVSSLVLLGSMGLNWDGSSQFDDNVTARLWASDLQLYEYWSDPTRLKADRQQAITEIIRARTPGYFFDRKKSLLISQTMKSTDFDFAMGDWIYKDSVNRKLDLAKMEAKFARPVLILHGRQDPGGESVPLALERHYKNSKLVFIEKCGHYSWVEQPEKVLTALSEFLAPTKAVKTDANGTKKDGKE